MNIAKSFGDALHDFRINLGMSQADFSEGICSDRQYKRLESNESEPSANTLNMLSNKFNIDFNNLYRFYLYKENRNSKEIIDKLNKAVIENDFSTINEICFLLENNKEKNKGEIYMYYCYAKALTCGDNDLGASFAIKGIKQESPYFDGTISSLTRGHLFSNVSYALLNYLAIYNRLIEQGEKSQQFYLYMLNSLENRIENDTFFYQSQTFLFNFYPKMVYNYCLLLWDLNKVPSALTQVNKSISLLSSHGSCKYLHYLLWCKCQSLYLNNQIKEAREEYSKLKCFCNIIDEEDYITTLLCKIKEKYPLLID